MMNNTPGATKKQQSALKRALKLAKNVFLIALVAALGFIGWNMYLFSDMFAGSYIDFVRSSQPLEEDRFGRSNILALGTSEGVEGSHAPLLTDSIIVLSINQKTLEGNMFSVPRDLWVNYDADCRYGSEGKINAVYSCGVQNGLSEKAAAETMAEKVAQITGTEIHYSVKINQDALLETIDILGGIEVTIDSPDPRGIYDAATGIKLPNGKNVINSEAALALSRARGWKGSYGLMDYAFARERHQKEIMIGVQQKAISNDVLNDQDTVIEMALALQNNVVSTIPARQLNTIAQIASNTNPMNIENINLNEEEAPLVTTGEKSGQSIVLPSAGLYDYSQIHKKIAEEFETRNLSVASVQ